MIVCFCINIYNSEVEKDFVAVFDFDEAVFEKN